MPNKIAKGPKCSFDPQELLRGFFLEGLEHLTVSCGVNEGPRAGLWFRGAGPKP